MVGVPAMRTARVVPRSPLRLPSRADGLTEGDRETRVRRLVHVGAEPVVLTVERDDGALVLRSEADSGAAAEAGLARARFWTGADDDLAPFLTRFAGDARIGRSVREAPWVRPYRRPMPFEVLLGAVCEQLITDERATEIKRRIVRFHGRRAHGLVDAPGAAEVAALAPAELERCGLAAARARTLVRAAREVAAGRVELEDPEQRERGWRRLRAIDGIGPWTLSVLALHGQGQLDALPAGDHAYRTAVAAELGRHPSAKAGEDEVLALFEPYRPFRGVAGWHLLRTRRQGRPRTR
jgi:3-methyladenine DNA glycosylase/8-oxoguanine DNA glycosylase